MRSVRHVGLGGRWKDRAGLSDLRRCGWTARVWCHACGLWCSTDLYLWCVVPLCLRRRSVQWRVPLATHPRGHTRETRTAVSSGERRRGVTQHACPSTEQRYLYRETHGETHISLIYYIIIILSQRYLYTSVWSLVSLSHTSLLVLPPFFLSFPGFHLSERTGRSQARGLPVDVLAYQAPGVPCGRRCREQLAHRAVLRAHEAHRHLAIRSL